MNTQVNKSLNKEDGPSKNKLHKDRIEKRKQPGFNTFQILSTILLVGLIWSLSGTSRLFGDPGVALAASGRDFAAVLTPTSPGSQFTFVPTADSFTDASTPTVNNGSLTQIRIDNSPIVNSYLRFDIQGLSGNVTKATLRIHSNSSSTTGYQVYNIPDTTWGETTMTYNNAPPFGSVAGSMGAFSSGVWTTVDVTSLITGNGMVSLALTGNGSTAVSFVSREGGANAPQLVITVGATTATPTNTPTSTQIISPTNTPTQVNTPTTTETNIPSSPTPTDTQSIIATDTPTQASTLTPTATNTSAPGPTATPTQTQTVIASPTSLTSTTTQFLPSADSYTDASNPNTNNGILTQIRIDNSPIVNSYLRFDVEGLSGSVTKATLRVHSNSSSGTGYQVYSIPDTTWGETTITSNNAPPFGSVAGSMGAFNSGVWTTVDVTSLITGNGLVSLALTGNGSQAVSFVSREGGANAPQLVITVGGASASPTVGPSNTPTSTQVIGPTNTPTGTSIPASPTPTSTQAISPTDTPTQAGTSTPTSTSIPPSPTPTSTQVPTATSTTVPASTSTPTNTPGATTIQHVFVVVMENHSYKGVWNTSSSPYITSLGNSFARATNYHATIHPSLPNYMELYGGSNYGITTDCNPSTSCHSSAVNLADNLEAKGLTWKGYMESMPSPCFLTTSGTYAPKHNPFVYFDDIRNNTARCASHVVPYSNLASDLSSAATTPNFGFITPNLCNDMHDCSVATGDNWLKSNLPAILNSPACTVDKCLLILTWDEDDSSQSNQVLTIFAGSAARTGGVTSAVSYSHYSTLRTVENIFGLPTQTSNDAGASPMTDLYR